MAVYTKTGDKGTTSLVGGSRVSKTDVRLEAYGSVDELSCFVAHLRDNIELHDTLKKSLHKHSALMLSHLSVLMNVSSRLACEEEYMESMPEVDDEDISTIEQMMDEMTAELRPIHKFTLPGGHPIASQAHIARTVCRRAERCMLRLKDSGLHLDHHSQLFINRLSDYLYLLSRLIIQHLGIEELYWKGKEQKKA